MSNKKKPIVHIDGNDYALDSYPSAQIEMLEFDGLTTPWEQVEELEAQGYTPDESVTEVHRHWDESKALANRAINRVYELGEVDDGIVGLAPFRDPEVSTWVGSCDGDQARNEKLTQRLEWLLPRGQNVVWVRSSHTGDGIVLTQTLYMVAFTDPAVEAAFLKRFPEVAA
jgi:hypothetical protein